MAITQQIVNGLLLGGVLALAALGFSIVWGILNIINLAHGTFVTFWSFKLYGLDPFL
jgi:branched-chain amino acid transport system permease protein